VVAPERLIATSMVGWLVGQLPAGLSHTSEAGSPAAGSPASSRSAAAAASAR
jgi:hypothetical protein